MLYVVAMATRPQHRPRSWAECFGTVAVFFGGVMSGRSEGGGGVLGDFFRINQSSTQRPKESPYTIE
jgi:hypothetical protein